MSEDWDAATYDRIADPMARWGTAVLDRLPLKGEERVLDAGCGSGRVTERLLARLPLGHVIALDASPAMIQEARRRLAPFAERVTYLVANLLDPLPIDPPVDAILSTATFHWVTDHDRLFRNLAAVLRPGVRLVAQCGGHGNVASVLRAAADVRSAWPESEQETGQEPWLFATAEETADRLRTASFVQIETWLHAEPTRIEPGKPLKTFLATVILREHLARLPESQQASFVRAVAGRIPGGEIDYVRLNIVAQRAA